MYPIILSTLLLTANASVIPDKVKLQNQNVVKMAAESLSKELPKKVDKFTSLIKIDPKGEKIIYTFEINSTKSDDALIKQDKTKMKKRIISGICSSSKRFLDSDISIQYIYTSAKSKKEILSLDVNKTLCDYPPE
jgi:hypothetical protein